MMNNKIAYAVSSLCLTSQLCFSNPLNNDNLLRNGDFNIPSHQVGSSSRYFGLPSRVMNNYKHPDHRAGLVVPYFGATAAQDWTYVLNNLIFNPETNEHTDLSEIHEGYFNTELLPSSLTEGGSMLVVDTNLSGNSILQEYTPEKSSMTINPVTACIWIYIERGSVVISHGDGTDDNTNTTTPKILSSSRQWKKIPLTSNTIKNKNNRITIGSYGSSGARFYLENIYLSTEFTSMAENNCKPE